MSNMRGRRVGGLMAMIAALAIATTAVGAAGSGSLVAAPVGASGSTVYMSVTNVGTEPVTAGLNLMLTSGSTTLVGSATANVAPLSSVVVPVQMSGAISLTAKLSLSSSLSVGISDSRDPFQY